MYGIREIDSRTLAGWLEAEDRPLLVDVRTPNEFAQGMIEGAELVPLHLVPLHAEQLVAGERPVVFYCRSGARSGQACAFIQSRHPGVRVFNLRGGVIDWVRQGLPLGRPAAVASR